MEKSSKKIGYVMAYARNHNNYGTSLQGYALLRKLRDMGYDPEIIQYKKHLRLWDKVYLTIQMLRCGAVGGKVRVVKERVNKLLHRGYAHDIDIRTRAVNAYKEEKLCPHFRTYDGYDALQNGSQNYSRVIVGSDQVWTPLSLYSRFYNLLFVDDRVPKIAYASSFGVSEIPDFQKSETGGYLNRFSKIGVREKRGKEIVEALSDRQAEVVADPTMLLTREEWQEEIGEKETEANDPYIFCYFLGRNEECRRAAQRLKEETGCRIVTIRHMDEYVARDERFGDEAPYAVDPNGFVRLISQAAYVCTDSFHCTVFSILFHRKFMTFYRFRNGKNSRNSRIDSLLGLLGLGDRLYGGAIEAIRTDIDYDSVDRKLTTLRENSLQFLQNSLKQEP